MKSDQPTKVRKYSQIVLIVLFGLSIMLGSVGCFIQHDLMPSFREQRNLASFPSSERIKSMNDVPQLITQFIADNFGFRKPLLSTFFKLRLDLLHADLGLPALLGEDGWIFVEGEVPSLRRQDILNATQASRIRDRLDAWCEYAHQNGAELVFFIGPNKSTIYPEKFPRYFQIFSNHPSVLDQVYGLDFRCNFIKVDLRKTLFQNRQELLYYKWGTHWNDRAAELAWNKIKETISDHDPELRWPIIESKNLMRPARPAEDSVWQWYGRDDPAQIMLPKIEITPITTINTKGGKHAKHVKLLVFGDSFLQFMLSTASIVANKYSAWVLGEGEQLKIQGDDVTKDAWMIVAGYQRKIEIMNEFKPNFVIIEIVEGSILSIADLPLPGEGVKPH